jgi:hypothetical protein
MATPKRKKPSPALHKAGKHLQKGSGDAGLALEERKKIKQLEAKNAALKRESANCTSAMKSKKKPKKT